MSTRAAGHFFCPSCEKRFTWKPHLAGRRAQCTCGAVLTVPNAVQDAPQESNDLYDIADISPPPARESAAVQVAIPVAPAPLSYRDAVAGKKDDDRFSFQSMTQPVRDLYLPTALVIVGYIAYIIWAAINLRSGVTNLALVLSAATVQTAIKSSIVIALAVGFAASLGVSLGDARTAILKIAGIVIFTDAASAWLYVILDHAGAVPHSLSGAGRILYYLMLVQLFTTAVIMGALSKHLFDLDMDDTAKVALPMAVLSRFIGFLLKLAVIFLLAAPRSAKVAASTPPTRAPNINSPSAAPSAPSAQAPVSRSEIDIDIAERIKRSDLIFEAREFAATTGSPLDKQVARPFYAAGARKVYFEFESLKQPVPKRMYIDLPRSSESRSFCFQLARSMQRNPAAHALNDTGQQFLVLEFHPR